MTASAPECVALAEGLREVRARTGLSLVALAERTAYSKSSWERYLNGKKPVPRQAVEALCATAGEPAGRLLALWELADAEWSGRARHSRPAVPPPPAPVSPPEATAGAVATAANAATAGDVGGVTGAPGRARPWRLLTVGVGAAAVAAVAVAAAPSVLGPGAGHPTSLASPVLDPAPGCRGKTCEGKDPGPMSCALPGRVESLGPQRRTRTGAGVEIRYSDVCAAAWGRIWHAKVGDAIEVSAPGSRPRRVAVRNTADTGAYRFTMMVGGADRTGLRLCFIPADGTGRECFDY
ncbi:helix-turn-helix domain-containing protein [Streptomyces hygroscopicus]|uniref:helix-turn-helix domain-containing protein n=1 Tax=Streptomyces hygroscopicus TaxID=1912 RepID=UPI000767B7BA|nr:XRE family transcriptional regulator [Streptomyces hygroscopicus]